MIPHMITVVLSCLALQNSNAFVATKGLYVPRPTQSRAAASQRRTHAAVQRGSSGLQMSLVPLSVDEVRRLIATGVPTASQYSTYWGRTPQEQYARMLESSIVSFLGVFFSYFLSFVVGGFVATILGALFVFWGILSPEFKAYQRNWEFLGGRDLVDNYVVSETGQDPERAGLYGSLFLGHVADISVVEDATSSTEYDLAEFSDYRMDEDELERYTGQPYLLRVQCRDTSGRELQVHARLSEEYLQVKEGMPLAAILLSTSPRFTTLAALTDLYVPDARCWIGDYPYLERSEVEALLAEDDDIWDALQLEAIDDGMDDTGSAFVRDNMESWSTRPEEPTDEEDSVDSGDQRKLYVSARRRR